MNIKLKRTLIWMHLAIMALAGYWFWDGFHFEPLIVLIGEIASILIVVFEKRITKLFVHDVSKSKITINPSTEIDMHVSNIKKDSEIEIK